MPIMRDCGNAKINVTLHSETGKASPPALPRREGSPMLITSEYVSAGRQQDLVKRQKSKVKSL